MVALNRLVNKNLETIIHCSSSLILSLGSQYYFLTSTTTSSMEVLKVFNNGLTGGKILLNNCLQEAMENGEHLQIICFLCFKGGISIVRLRALQ